MSDELRELEQRWAEWLLPKDRAALDGLLADDFVLTSAGGVGAHVTREEWFENLDRIETRDIRVSDVTARIFGDVGVAKLLLHWDASLPDRSLTGDYAITDVFTRADGAWRVSWRISTRLTS